MFDYTVHVRDPNSGRVVEKRPYRRIVTRDGVIIERDGQRYHEDGSAVEDAKPAAQAAKPGVIHASPARTSL